MSTKVAQQVLKILAPVFIAVLSIFILSSTVPKSSFFQDSLASLDKSNTTVMEFTGATISTSLAISALPDDFATPLADSLADMNKYFVLILVAIFLERLLIVEGVKISLLCVIPVACGLYIISTLMKSDMLQKFAWKVAILAIALIFVVPCSTHLNEAIGSDYLAYVEETIEETNAGADKINDAMENSDGEKTIFEKLTDVFQTAIRGITDLLQYFKNIIKKCINSIAILIVTTCVMPLLTFLFLKWLLNELFSLHIPMPRLRGHAAAANEPVAEEVK